MLRPIRAFSIIQEQDHLTLYGEANPMGQAEIISIDQARTTRHFTQLRQRLHECFDQWLDTVREQIVGPFVDTALRWRYLFVGSVIGLFLATLSLMPGGIVKFVAFPELDGDVVVARVLLPPGAPLRRTENVVKQITSALDGVNAHFASRQPAGQDLVRTVVIQFNENVDAFENGPHVATVTVDLLQADVRDASIDEILPRRSYIAPIL